MMEKYITDERTGLKYELVGDYYLIAGDDEPEQEQEPIGIWGQRHLRYLKEHRRVRYANLLTTGKLNDYLADLNEQAEAMFSQLVKLLAQKEGVTEAPQSRKPDALGAENEQSAKRCNRNRFKRAYLPLEMTTIKKEHKCVCRKAGGCRLSFSAVNRKRPTGCSILISGGDGGVTAKRGLFWYVDGELLCFPVSGDGSRYGRQQSSAVLENASAFPYRRDVLQLLSPWASRAAARESAWSICIPRSAHRELIPGFAMPFHCRMRCRCRSRPTGAGTTGVFRRNRRDEHWTYSH